MYTLITILIIFICVLMILVVLVKNPKGGGLGAGFGGGSANLMGGVKQTTDFLDKTTWGLAIALFAMSILANAFIPSDRGGVPSAEESTIIENVIDNTSSTPLPAAPAAQPVAPPPPAATPPAPAPTGGQ